MSSTSLLQTARTLAPQSLVTAGAQLLTHVGCCGSQFAMAGLHIALTGTTATVAPFLPYTLAPVVAAAATWGPSVPVQHCATDMCDALHHTTRQTFGKSLLVNMGLAVGLNMAVFNMLPKNGHTALGQAAISYSPQQHSVLAVKSGRFYTNTHDLTGSKLETVATPVHEIPLPVAAVTYLHHQFDHDRQSITGQIKTKHPLLVARLPADNRNDYISRNLTLIAIPQRF